MNFLFRFSQNPLEQLHLVASLGGVKMPNVHRAFCEPLHNYPTRIDKFFTHA